VPSGHINLGCCKSDFVIIVMTWYVVPVIVQ